MKSERVWAGMVSFFSCSLGLSILCLPAWVCGQETVLVPKKHLVEHKDTLWDLSEHYYGDPWQWPKIWEANKSEVQNPDLIYPDQVLLIPNLTERIVKKRLPEVSPTPEPAEPEPVAEKTPPPELETPPEEKGVVRTQETLSEDFPIQMTGMEPSMAKRVVPLDWTAEGQVIVSEDKRVETLAEKGDVVTVELKGISVPKGAWLGVFRKAGPSQDKQGIEIQKVAQLRVLSAGSRVQAKVVRIHDAVQVGDWVKVE